MKRNEIRNSQKTILGLEPIDFLGILIMLIPFLISFKSFTYSEIGPKFEWWFIRLGRTTTDTKVNLNPGLVSALCAVAFYFPLIIRLDLFKADALLDGILSVVRTFLNCFVIAALLSIIVTTQHIDKPTFEAFFQNHQTGFLFMGIVLSWIGMRTISGYCWILFIVAAFSSFTRYDRAMGIWGAVFIITLSISLFLQLSAHVKVTDVVKEFRGSFNSVASTTRVNMSVAAADATQRANDVSTFVKDNVAAYTPIKIRTTPQNQTPVGTKPVYYVGKNTEQTTPVPSRSMPEGNAEDILKALDVNGDGVVDEKDIELLRKK